MPKYMRGTQPINQHPSEGFFYFLIFESDSRLRLEYVPKEGSCEAPSPGETVREIRPVGAQYVQWNLNGCQDSMEVVQARDA